MNIVEVKVSNLGLEQINSKKYEEELKDSGITNIYRYAIAISSKECSVK